MAGSRVGNAKNYGRGRPRNWAGDSAESRIKRTYEKVVGLKVDPKFEYLLAEYTWRVHKAKGYVETLNGVKLHRLITGATEGLVVDHINGDKLDNRQANLRVCVQAENCRNNRKPRRDKRTSQYKGVHFGAREKRWKAQIQVNNQKIPLGTYKTEIEAALAYDEAASLYHGVFAAPNFPKKSA